MHKTILELEREAYITNDKSYAVIDHILKEFKEDYSDGYEVGRQEGYNEGWGDAEDRLERAAFDRGWAAASAKYATIPSSGRV